MAGDRGAVAVAVLLAYNDETFTKKISSMEPKALMDTISSLQQEMKTEQESFNSLSQQLEGLRDKRTQQYRQISKDLMASQSRLTLLMNRSMQCFSQQPSRTQTIDRKRAATQENTVIKEDVSEPSVKTQAPVQQTNVNHLSNSVWSGNVQKGNQIADSNRPKTSTQNSETTRVKVSLTEQKPSNHISQSNSNYGGAKNSQVKNHVHVQSKDLQSMKMNTVTSTNSSGSSFPTERGQKDIVREAVSNKQVSNHPRHIQRNGDEMVKEEPKKIVYKIPQVSALRQTFEQKKPDDIPGKGRKVSLNVSGKSSVGKADNVSAREVPNSKSKQTYRSSVQMGSNSDATTSQAVRVNGDSKQTSSNGHISKFENPPFKTTLQMDSVDHKTSVSDNRGVQAAQHKTNIIPNQKISSTLSSGKNSTGVFQNQADPVPVTSIDDIINERPESSQNSHQRSDSQKLNITSVVSKSHNQVSDQSQSLGAESNAGVKIDPIEEDQDVVQSRIHLTSWDPTPLLKELYAVRLLDETTEDLSHRFISMEGVMEKLPMGKRKSTLLKTWKRRYFKAADGWLHYYEHNNYEKPCHSFQLMGGSIEVLDSRILGIDDGRGHYLMVRCPTPNDFENWRVSLESQTTDNVKAVHVRPVLNSQPHPSKKVVIIDIGSASVRAGILGKEASLPQVFFPTVVAKKTSSGECVVGFDAYRPDIRNQSTLHYPIRPSVKVDKGKSLPFNIDMSLLPYVFDKIFSDLKVDSKCYWVLLSTPQMLADKLKTEIMDVLTRRCGVQGVCIAPQALLAMYSYKATSGIIVDVGERIDILPISDGYIVEGGVTRHPFGGEKVADSLKQSLTRLHYHFFSEVERLIIRHVMEKTCYIPHVFSEEMKQFQENPGSFSKTVSLKNFGLPEGTYSEVTHDEGCFRSAEGFFDTNIWGTDFPSLHKLVHKAIIECPMDNRREMCRSIFLSGGVTLLPGFAERLEREITKLVPPGLTIQVHASPQRYHSAFIGGCTLAAQDLFQQTCISREDWIKNGVKELKKWHIPS